MHEDGVNFAFKLFMVDATRSVLTVYNVFNDLAWHDVTAVYDGATMYGYVDGVLKASRTVNKQRYTPNTDLQIGSVSFQTVYPFMISNTLIYSRALTDSEVRWNYLYPDNPIRNGLVLWLKADPQYVKDIDGDGVLEWLDLSGFNNHGKIYGARLVELIKTPARALPVARLVPVAR
jgi:hypothetical protein